ncbi:ABCB1 [Symbiodinium necroappetens]|uniref:ABCB1 protein n=1 Tax=Symbiodinium necroappetens TaxID=1628268 RepID=A0A812N8G4_9DINO|nr:ABCB1 [Symbiodinium necroappetens]
MRNLGDLWFYARQAGEGELNWLMAKPQPQGVLLAKPSISQLEVRAIFHEEMRSIRHVSQANSWEQLSPNGTAPSARVAHTAVWSPEADGFYAFGGTDSPGPESTSGNYCPCNNLGELWFYARQAKPRLAMWISMQGSQLTSLLPTDVSHWWPSIEDVFTSSAVRSLSSDMMAAFCNSNEFGFLSLDATIKCCMSVMGQESYIPCLKHKRDAAPFDDNDSLRRVLTVRGRTGAVLAMIPVSSEKAEEVTMALGQALPAAGLQQVQCTPSDAASLKLFTQLRRIMPGVELRDQDRYATWRKKTAGAVFLRRVMSKFNGVSVSLPADHWGNFHKGYNTGGLSRRVLALLPSGTSSNEALHSEVKNWFAETQQIHQSTLRMKLLILTLGKQIPHFHAMANPTISQCSSRILMARTITNSLWTELTWQTWCAELSSECRVQKASLPYIESRAEEVSKVREFTKKRPAAARKSHTKRTPFTLERVSKLRTQGVRKRKQ